MTNFTWFFRFETFLLRTVRLGMYLALTLLLTSNYFHVRLDAGLLNRCRINGISLESSCGWRLTRRQNTLFNSFLFLGKDESRDTSVSVPIYVVTKLMQLIFKRGYNVTCDNFFTRLDVALYLADQKCSIMATIRQNRGELLKASKKKQQQHGTSLFASTQTATVTLTSY